MPGKSKNVQVPYEYFVSVIHLMWKLEKYDFDEDTQGLIKYLTKESWDKAERMVNRELYSKFKDTGLSEDERKKALNEYLDKVGCPSDWRW